MDIDQNNAQSFGLWTSDDVESLRIYVDMLRHWSGIKNLISKNSFSTIWMRHFADSAQLLAYAPPHFREWVDIGSGAGFPGMVIAILKRRSHPYPFHFIESDHRKCAFLRDVSRETGVYSVVHWGRIEEKLDVLPKSVDVVSARALAAMGTLIKLSHRIIHRGAWGLFLKGKNLERELTQDLLTDKFKIEITPSLIDPQSRIVVVKSLNYTMDKNENYRPC